MILQGEGLAILSSLLSTIDHPTHAFLVGFLFHEGLFGVPRDWELAKMYFLYGIRLHKDGNALLFLGYMAEQNVKCRTHRKNSRQHYNRAIRHGMVKCSHAKLGWFVEKTKSMIREGDVFKQILAKKQC